MLRFSQFLLLENRVEYLKTQHTNIDTSHDTFYNHPAKNEGENDVDYSKRKDSTLIDHIASHDPTPKKLYTGWLVKSTSTKSRTFVPKTYLVQVKL